MRVLLIASVLAACGADPSSKDGQSAMPPQIPQADQGIPEPAKDPQAQALLIADASKIPPCSIEAEGTLVYVKSDEAFMACSSGTWERIDIHGKDGTSGENGKDGKDGLSASANLWKDPMTGSVWMSLHKGIWTIASKSCKEGWRLPTKDELVEAQTHHLWDNVTSTGEYWSWSTDIEGDLQVLVNARYGGTMTYQNYTGGIFCLMENSSL